MKKMILVFFLSPMLAINSMAQNWLTSGNALSANGTLGSTTNFSVVFKSNNSERGRLTNSGLWGFGTTAPSSKVHINSVTGQIPFRVQVNASTKFLVHSNGGVSIGSGSTPPANGLYVSGNVGIGTATPSKKLQVTGKSLFTDSLVVSDGGINVTNKKGYGVSSTGVGYGLYGVGTNPDPSAATYGVVASGTTGVYGVGSKNGSFGTRR